MSLIAPVAPQLIRPVTWLVAPYDTRLRVNRKTRFVAVDTYTPAIVAAGGDWREAEIDGDRAVVAIDAPADIIAQIVADRAASLLKDQAEAESLIVPRKKGRLDDQGNFIFDGAVQWTKAVADLAAEMAPFAARDVPQRSGPNGTAVLDAFNRSDENPLSGGGQWSSPLFAGTGNLRLVSNVVRYVTGGVGEAYWNPGTFNVPCEVHAKAPSWPSNNGWLLYLCVQQPGTGGWDGYLLYGIRGDNLLELFRIDNEAFTQLGSSIAYTGANNDSMALDTNGTTLTIWAIDDSVASGVWSSKGTRTDSTYTTGYIGLATNDSTSMTLDDFGGGSFGGGGGPTIGHMGLLMAL